MRLWTIQYIDFYKELVDKKVISGKIENADSDFLFGYNWMINQMEKRIDKKPNDSYPIWAWLQYESINKPKPDLRTSGFLKKGTKGVRLEIKKDNDSVLLSDFELWHTPLSYKTYIGDSEDDANKFDKFLKLQGLGDMKFENLPDKIKHKIILSWDKIFDLDFDCEYYAQPKEKKSIQATFWKLKIDDVIKVDYFVAR